MATERPWTSVYAGQVEYRPFEGSLVDLLDEAVDRWPERTAVTAGDRTLTYAELGAATRRVAAALDAAGIGRGDRVGLMLPNCPEYMIAFFATMRRGAVATQVNPMYVGRELAHILGSSGTTTLVVHAAAYPRAVEIRDRVDLGRVVVVGQPDGELRDGDTSFADLLASTAEGTPDVALDPATDLASIQFTGGTTGVSKGAMLTHRNLLAGLQPTIDLLIEDPDEFPADAKVVAVAPFFHIFGLTMVLLLAVRHGWNLLLVPRFQPDELVALIEREQPVYLAGVATLFTALASYPGIETRGLDRVRLYTSGGASVPVGLLRAFESMTGRTLFEGYGLSEGAPVSFNTRLRGSVPGSIGVPIPGTDVRVVDTGTGAVLGPGQPGELCVRGPQVMQGYWGMPGETAAALRDGWLHTGDIATMDHEGYLVIVDRKKDMINASGFKVYPREVEEVLYAHDDVVEAAVVGVADDYRGETVKAVVVAREGSGLTGDDVRAHCRAQLAAYKVPTIVEFRDQLPKSAVGKILRRELT